MIEILVTVIVFSIGLLGIIGMQTVGLRNNTAAYNRSQATILAYDLADRARANPNGAANYDLSTSLPSSTVSACETTSGCSNSQMAQYDVYNWLQYLTQGLPAGTGTICIDSTPDDDATPADFKCDGIGSVYTIKVWWDEEKDGTYKMFYTEFKI
jgi:type IV pilus assembly protein PilV